MSPLNRRQALRLMASMGAAGAAAPILSACGTGTQSSTTADKAASLPPIKIGVILPLTGILKSDGDELGNGFRLYVKLNGSRFGGRTTEVIYADEGASPAAGKLALDTLLKQNVVAVSGVVSSAVMTSIKDTVEAAKVPLVGSNASPSSLKGVQYIWRTSWGATDPGQALGKYVAEHTDGTVALMAPDYAAGHDFVDGFKKTFLAAGGKLEPQQYWTQFVPTPNTNFEPFLSKIKASSAKAVYCFYASGLASEFIKQYRQLNMPQVLYAPGFLTEGAPLKAAGNQAEGIWTAMNYSPDLDNAANRSFFVAYHKEYDRPPTTFAMAAYDAAQVLDRAVRLAGSDLSGQSLNAAIGHVGNINSARGEWQFGQNRTPMQKWFLRQVRMDGRALANVIVAELTTLDGTT